MESIQKRMLLALLIQSNGLKSGFFDWDSTKTTNNDPKHKDVGDDG